MVLNFTASIDRNILRVQDEVNRKAYKITIELFLSVVRLTPSPAHPGDHAVGLLVNQWYPHTGSGFSASLDSSTSDDGNASQERIHGLRGGTEFLGKDGRISLANNLHYAVRAEKIGWPKSEGWSGKVGPYRMVMLSLALIAAKYK